MTTKTLNLTIRAAKTTDAERILKIYTPYITNTTISFEFDVPSITEMADRINTHSQDFPYLVAEQNGKVIGYTYAKAFASREAFKYDAELSIYVDEATTANGVGQELFNNMETRLIDQGIIQLVSTIALPNEASVGFHKKNGFEQIGHFPNAGYKFNAWHDIVWMLKSINDLK